MSDACKVYKLSFHGYTIPKREKINYIQTVYKVLTRSKLFKCEFSAPRNPPSAGCVSLDLKAPPASRAALSNRLAKNSCVNIALP